MGPSSDGEAAIEERLDGPALRLIVAYKLVKAAAELLLGALLLTLLAAGLAQELVTVASTIRAHAVEAWSIALVDRLIRASTERNLLVVALALVVDGLISLVEGWALHYRYRWSGWFVLGTTSCLLPVEIIVLLRHFSAGRVVLLIVNVLIVLYLIQVRGSIARKPA